eukprot:TRINITY_DN16608_c0_g2_i2.p1 TRINITY_DN16608_c0_g2~~TRINITY_DN16608_c0_g2_i2.p1  ORF type:complete len:202 (+),score=32.05 TRINITY_DN16608_c0_g2_i2:77-682(+)
MLQDMLPKVNYVTLIDRYILILFILSFAIVMENYYVAHDFNDYDQEKIFQGSCILWVLLHAVGAILLWVVTEVRSRETPWCRFNDTLWLGPIRQDADERSIRREAARFGSVLDVRVWNAVAARSALAAAGVEQQYGGTSRFAIVRMKREKYAVRMRKAIRRRSGLTLVWAEPNMKVEFLNLHWRPLLHLPNAQLFQQENSD